MTGVLLVLLLVGVVDPVARFDDGAVRFATRDLVGARAAFVDAIVAFEEEGRAIDAALAREALARVQIEQADWLGALETLDAARPTLDDLPPRHPHRARHEALRAIVLQAVGDLDASEEAHERALAEYRALSGNQNARVAAMLQNLATLTADRGDSLLTSILLNQALDIVDRNHGADDVRRARPLVTWAQWRLAMDDLDGARRGFEEADRLVVAARGDDHPDRIEILRGRARVAAAVDSVGVARRLLERAGSIYEVAWARGGSDLLRATAFRSPFGEAAGLMARAGHLDAAWSAWEDHVGRLAESGRGAVDPDDVVAALREGEAFVGWVEDVLPPERGRRRAFVITRSGLRWVDLGTVSRGDDEAALRARLASFDDGDPGDDLARTVFARWFGSAGEVLDGVSGLVAVPTGALLGVPLAALITENGERLGERVTVTRFPSATVFVRARREATTPSAERRLLAVADPRFGDGSVPVSGVEGAIVLRSAAAGHAGALAALPPLHGTRDEVEAVAAHFASSVVLAGGDATEAALEAALADRFDVIHVATHALVDPVDPARSTMVLTGAGATDSVGPDDGLLSLREILDGWRLDAELVTLSACETGLGRATPTEGLLGFPYALMSVGARSVLVSAWKVDDRATARWMRAFYDAWLVDGVSRPEAVRVAQRTVREWTNGAGRRPFADPAFWAGFGLVGE